jgi:hypothetical protein
VARKGANRPILREKRPPKKCPPNIGADIGAITGILLIVSDRIAPLLRATFYSIYIHLTLYVTGGAANQIESIESFH